MKITKGDKYDEMTIAVKEQDGQCPCVPKYARTEDTKCICKEFLESEEIGHCHCRRYQKVEVD